VGLVAKAWARSTPVQKREIVGHLATAARVVAGRPVEFTRRTAEDLA